MIIKHLEVENFMGYKGKNGFDMPKIAALVGYNGIGKTSILNSIRYALAGEEPDGDIINSSADTCTVSITLEDPVDGSDIVFARSKSRSKPSKFMIDGAKTTAAKLNEKISDVCGIPIDKIKILSSAEVVASMKPQEFAKFILDYIPEKVDINFIIDHLDMTNPQILDTIDANLPSDNIDMTDIDAFLNQLKSTRKELKPRIADKKAVLETKPKEAPADREELEAKLKHFNEILNRKEVLEAKKKAYESALENKTRQEEQLAALKKDYDKIAATRPDPAIREGLVKERDEVVTSIRNKDVEINGATSALRQLEITLDALNKPICPVSPLITCHTDKSIAKEEITESIEATKAGLAALSEDSEKLSKKLQEIEEKLSEFDNQTTEYQKKVTLAKMIKQIEDNPYLVPEKPEMDVPDVSIISVQIDECKKLLALIDEYMAGIVIEKEIEALTDELNVTEYLIKVLSDKGCVRTAILSKYVTIFEDLLNERSGKIRSDITFTLVPEDGIKVFMDTGNGMLSYENLSGGEKAYMLFMIMDMLNSLSGTKILFIDELSVMDSVNFNALLDIITEYQGEYDHIIFAAVNHTETVEAVKAHGIPMLSLTNKVDIAA
nr:AAA family ATPase [uncultured Butyrivibrio sp.]